MSSKICRGCHEEKPIDAFTVNKALPDKRQSKCLACFAIDRKRRTQAQIARQKEKSHEHYIAYREHHNAKTREQYRTNIPYRLTNLCRNRVIDSFERFGLAPPDDPHVYLGCTGQQLQIHIEAQFKPGMTWENHGRGNDKWQIDHIKPIGSFDLTNPQEAILAFHYTNIRPTWHREHASKTGQDRSAMQKRLREEASRNSRYIVLLEAKLSAYVDLASVRQEFETIWNGLKAV